MEWWDTKGNSYAAPSRHLFKELGIDASAGKQRYAVGRGAVYILRQNPKEYVMDAGGDTPYLTAIKQAWEMDAKAGTLQFKNALYLERGPYDIIAVLDENADSKPYTVKGPVIDLFDPQLPVLKEKEIQPGEQSLLYDCRRMAAVTKPRVLAGAARVYDEKPAAHSYSFVAKSPVNTLNSMRVWLPAQPANVTVTDDKGNPLQDAKSSWDAASKTEWLSFANSPEGVKVELKW